MTLRARIVVRRPNFVLDVDIELEENRTLALVGPNGAGKSSVLHALGGLVPIDDGIISVDGRVFDDPTSSTWVDPSERDIGVVFQGGLLFDTMTVGENIVFGLRARGSRRARAVEVARPLVEHFGLGDLLTRRPRELSGGQIQRVAIARALLVRPRVLLLDEPTSTLDSAARREFRGEFRRILDGFAGYRILVTHDPGEARALADRVIVLERGRIVRDVAARDYSGWSSDTAGE